MVDINFSGSIQSEYNFRPYRNAYTIYDNIAYCLKIVSSDNSITPGVILGIPFVFSANDNYKITVDAEAVVGNPFIYTGYNQKESERLYINSRGIYETNINFSYEINLTPGILLSQNKPGDLCIVYSFTIKKINDALYVKLAEPDVIVAKKNFNSLITFDTGIFASQVNTKRIITNPPEDITISCGDSNKNIILDNNVIITNGLSLSNGISMSGNTIANCTNISSNSDSISFKNNRLSDINILSFPDISLTSREGLQIIENDGLIYGRIYDTYYNKPRLEVYDKDIQISKIMNQEISVNNCTGAFMTFNYHSYKFNKFILSITNLEIKIEVSYVGQSPDWIKLYLWLSTNDTSEISNKIWFSINPKLGIISYTLKHLFDLLCYTPNESNILTLNYSAEFITDHIIILNGITIKGLMEATVPFIPYIEIN
jgi:hypothetical protein